MPLQHSLGQSSHSAVSGKRKRMQQVRRTVITVPVLAFILSW